MAATVTIDFNANLARFSSSIDKATADLNKFQSNAQRMASNVKGAFSALTAGFAVGSIVAFAKSTIDAADAMNDLSVRTGVAVKDLASLKAAAEQNGTSLDAVAKGMQKITLAISEAQNGNKEYAESLQRLGVTSKEPRAALFQLADAVKASNDPTKHAADLQKVLSRNYVELLPLLSQGSEELRKSAQASESFADAMARAAPEADKFNDALVDIKTNAAGTSATLLVDMMPVLKGLLVVLSGVAEGFVEVGTSIGASAAAAAAATKGEFKDAAVIMTTLFDDLDKRQTDFKKRMDAILAPAQPGAGGGSPGSAGASDLGKIACSTAGGSKSDPLASLLGSTDIGKLKTFEQQVALLNARFNYGKKESELYAQAMTKLVEATFANNFKQAAEDAEFMNMVLEDGQNTINEFGRAWEEAGAALTAEMRTPMENLNLELGRLQELLDRGAISWETYTRAVLAAEDKLNAGGDQIKTTKTLAEELGLVFESTFEKAIGAGASFQDVLKGLLADIIKVIARTQILIPLLEGINGKTSSTGGGVVYDFGKSVGDWIKDALPFANGGIMTPGGPLPLNKYAMGGIANTPQLALFGEGRRPEAFVPLPDGRRIPVHMQGGGQVVNNNNTINIKADNPSEVRASRGQIMADISNQMARANRWR